MQNDFGTAELEIAEMAESRFQTLNEEKIAELLNDKDSKNTQKGTKGSRLIFDAHLQERNLIRKPATDGQGSGHGFARILRLREYILSFLELWKYFE